MQLHIPVRSSGYSLVGFLPASGLIPTSWLQRVCAVCIRRAQAWRAHRRVARDYRRDLQTLAGMGERDLADFGAPCWLRADVSRYR